MLSQTNLVFVVGIAVGALAMLAAGRFTTFAGTALDTTQAARPEGVSVAPLAQHASFPIGSELSLMIDRMVPRPPISITESTNTISLPLDVPAPTRKRSTYQGSLHIESEPGGATVYLNNQRAGTTPLRLTGVPVGSRAVRLQLEGFEPWFASIRITTLEVARVSAHLRLRPSQHQIDRSRQPETSAE